MSLRLKQNSGQENQEDHLTNGDDERQVEESSPLINRYSPSSPSKVSKISFKSNISHIPEETPYRWVILFLFSAVSVYSRITAVSM